MNKDLLIFNIRKFCEAKNMKPTPACDAAGVGHSFLTDIKRDKMPSIEKVCTLAEFLGVSVSDLVGDAKTPAELAPIAAAWAELNDDGRAEAIRYIEYLYTKPEYIKNCQNHRDQKGGAVG